VSTLPVGLNDSTLVTPASVESCPVTMVPAVPAAGLDKYAAGLAAAAAQAMETIAVAPIVSTQHGKQTRRI
jgi:hypothetical protein